MPDPHALANLGVLVALVLGAVGYALTSAARVRRQAPDRALEATAGPAV